MSRLLVLFLFAMPLIGVSQQASEYADIVSVTVTGTEGDYTFNVGISSPDKGCEQYANWWEVISEDGELIYRRILGHSHVNEQPFVRSGKVEIDKNQVVIVRAHMNTVGYGGMMFKGSIESGFEEISADVGLVLDLEKEQPLPSGCAF